MVKSMTGYGRAEQTADGRTVCVEMKSVNHRYLEITCRLPRTMLFLEDTIKGWVQQRVARGKVELFVTVEDEGVTPARVTVNHALAAAYAGAVQELAETYGLPADLTAADLARVPEVLTVHRPPEEEETLTAALRPVVERAIDAFLAMRQTEGERLAGDIREKLQGVLRLVEEIEAEAPKTQAAYRARLEEKLRELLTGPVDEQRLLTETALFADRVAVDEETVRLRSHLAQMESLLCGDEPAGRKLDFLMQEANREINTVGSKAQNTAVAHRVVAVKAELEKMREQIQNLE